MISESKRYPKDYCDCWDVSNVVAYALGAESRYLQCIPRTSALYSLPVLKQDEGLTYLRALSIVRQILIKSCRAKGCAGKDNRSISSLFKFPSEVIETFTRRDFAPFRSKNSPLFERVNGFSYEIEKHIHVLDRYLPQSEEHKDWVYQLASLPIFKDNDEITRFSRKFTSYSFPMGIVVNCSRSCTEMFSSDFYLMHVVYSEHGEELKCWEKYKSDKLRTRATNNYTQASISSDAFEFLKSLLCSDERTYALIDSQNVPSVLTYRFLDWINLEYSDAIAKVIVFRDGKEHWSWEGARNLIKFPVEFQSVPRLRKSKSVLDTAIITTVMQLFYESDVSNFLIFSGDCDFIPLVSALPKARFCFCGVAGSTSINSVDFAKTHRAKFLTIDEFLTNVYQNNGSYLPQGLDTLVHKLNEEELSMVWLVEAVAKACKSMGKAANPYMCINILNELFSRTAMQLTQDGILEFVNHN